MSSPSIPIQSNPSDKNIVHVAPQDELGSLSSALGFSIVQQETLENKAQDEIKNKIAEANDIKEAKKKLRLEANEKKEKLSKKNKSNPTENEVDLKENLDLVFPLKEDITQSLLKKNETIQTEFNFFSDNSEEFSLPEEILEIAQKGFEPPKLPGEKNHSLEIDTKYDDSEYLPEDELPKRSKAKRKIVSSDSEAEEFDYSEEVNSSPKYQVQAVDDLESATYRARVNAWLKTRASHRTVPIEGHEKDAPHPLYKDAILEGGAKVPGEIFKDLMDYQKIGVKWFWKLFQWKQGGVLADEMGLGKTIQTIAFLATLYYSKKLVTPSLVICPATLSQQWVQELHRWWPPFRVINLHIAKLNKIDRGELSRRRLSKRGQKYAQVSKLIRPFFKRGNIFITSYEGFMSYGPRFAREDWGCVILDEGHKISNPDTQISKATKLLETPYRYILSGTPIQNKLKELWSIYDFIRPGLLGTQEEFDKRIARSIELTGSKGKDIYEKQLAYACARNLRSVIKNNLLRRLKLDVALELPKKTEQVVYCKLHPYQRHTYIRYLDSQECQSILNDKLNHMTGITALRKICNHPDLVYFNHGRTTCPEYGHYNVSGKTRVLDGLLKLWKANNHRVLIFCQTIQTQDILRGMNFFKEIKFLCMNGKTNVANRMELVDTFNTDPSIFVFLLTTRTGGQGLNLTGADRVVIFDPDWNPSADLQALSRAWRLGQSKEVSIYRLLTSGTIEERVHHLQLYKQLLSDRILKNPQQKLLFRNHDNDLFAYPPEDSEVKSINDSESYQKASLSSIEEAEKALSIAESFYPEPAKTDEEIDKPDANQQSMLDMIGVGNESFKELDKNQKVPIDSVSQKLDRLAADKFFGLNSSLQLNGYKNKQGLPDLSDAAFTRKKKRPVSSVDSNYQCNLEKTANNGTSDSKWNIEKLQRTNNLSPQSNIEKLQKASTSTKMNSTSSAFNQNNTSKHLIVVSTYQNRDANPFASISRPSANPVPERKSFNSFKMPNIISGLNRPGHSQQTMLPFRPSNQTIKQENHQVKINSRIPSNIRQNLSNQNINTRHQTPNSQNLTARPTLNQPGYSNPFVNRTSQTTNNYTNRTGFNSQASSYFRPRPSQPTNSFFKRFDFSKK